jgi:imidazolonepropionase-like amidohydrolase
LEEVGVIARSAVAFCLVLSFPAAVRAEKDPVYALVGGRIVTVSGPTLESGTLVLRDGVIDAVGAAVAVPADARVIDAKGLTLTPGLIDALGGVGLPAAPAARPGGGGPGGGQPPPANPLAPQALALEKLRAADALKARDSGVTTVLVIPAEGVLPGRSALLNLSGEKPEGMVLKQPAALHLRMTALRRQYPSSLMGTLALARQSLYDAIRYRDEWAAYERAPRGKKRPRYDSALEAWQDVLSGRLPLVVGAHVTNDLRRALALADEFKIRVIAAEAPSAHALAELIRTRRLPLIVGVNFDPPRAAQFFGADDEEKEKKDIEQAERNPAALHKAGVAFALGSGHAKDYLAGVRKAIEKGLPREAALEALTLTAAEVLGVADRTGSLETGKIANVVAWSGEPLAKDTQVKLVFVDGRLHEPSPPEKPEDRKSSKPEVPAGGEERVR